MTKQKGMRYSKEIKKQAINFYMKGNSQRTVERYIMAFRQIVKCRSLLF